MPAQVSFRHVFLDAARRGEAAARAEADRLLAALQGFGGGADPEGAGDRFLPGYAFRQVAAPEIGRRFGGDVAAALEAAPVGRWTGPVPSAYGLHLLRVEARADPRLPPLDEIRPALRAEWAARRRREALDASVAALVSRYAVTVEGGDGRPRRGGAVRMLGRQQLRTILLALLATAAPATLAAHEVRPAYLELRPAGHATWNVLWKVPAFGQSHRLRVDAQLPEGCAALAPRRSEFVADAYVERWSVRCPAGLAGGVVRFEGLSALRAEVLLRIERPDGRDAIPARVTSAEPTFAIPAEPSLAEVARTYLELGVHHILLGVDHLLFVLALLLIVRGWRRLALTATAFTVGHTLTLAGATLGMLSLPGPPVEAAIALSIAFAAAEAMRARRGEPSLTAQAPWAVALFFGLLHGLGFAGALREVGVPEGAVLPALLFFNLGVELGQLLFVAVALGLAWGLRRLVAGGRAPSSRAHAAACYAIGVTAAFWLVERVQGFWS